ncbi:MAG: HAD family hydrolase [Succinivibrionaceae bacterium]
MKSKEKIIFAIAYDFDGTLSDTNMQEYDFIPKLGVSPSEFWDSTHKLSQTHLSDPTLTYMYLMLKKAREKDMPIRYDDFVSYGKDIRFFSGIDTWFDRITNYGKELNIEVEHYIISSGLGEIIQGSYIAQKFKKIFASRFMYDANGVACWPAVAINYTTKTQYLYRINKGALDESDNTIINTYIPDNKRRIPFDRILFIGDGSTDIPCFRLLKSLGGYSIAVYNKNIIGSKEQIKNIACNGHRTSLVFDTDYSENSKMENAVKSILQKAATEANLILLEKEVLNKLTI